ncbi:MAG: nucleoside-diphosphate sugar epimerase/dehydratase [Bacteroidales bacterium]|nr:nucleoside-diphosphate sugar epimerase/dehydratase [Bacteroidales bacterium]MDY6075970.1 nucleoside-diphosphate sugar epimerase/dehydratase [Bacteroidales bacterium]
MMRRIINWYFSRKALPYWCILVMDCVIVFLSGLFVFYLQHGWADLVSRFAQVSVGLLVSLILYIVSFFVFHTYNGVMRYSSFVDLHRVAYSTAVAGVGVCLLHQVQVHLGLSQYILIPRVDSAIMLFIVATMLMWCLRVVVKGLHDSYRGDGSIKKVFVYGCMEGGVALAKSLRNESPQRYRLGGFITTDKTLHGTWLLGEKVYLDDDSLVRTMEECHVSAVLVSPLQREYFITRTTFIDALINAGIKILITPAGAEEWDGKSDISYQQLREVEIEDLLPRDKIDVDMEAIGKMLAGRRILITGAAGSIGSEMSRQVAKFKPADLILVDQAETPMHDMRMYMANNHKDIHVETIVTSICKQSRMEAIFAQYKPEYVFHAAAYKHVPMMEDNPAEAVQNNVFGTRVIADLAVKYGTKKFVMISTDKAVNPTNVMGCSKRICEIYCQSLNNSLWEKTQKTGKMTTQFVTTRFGNVLGSNGSVIPIFKEQIKKGGPVTVTHQDIIRYFMLIPEACRLVLQAGTMGHGGEIYVFDMGKPVRIADLAKRMIDLSGAKNIEIKFTGLRDGEKLYEEVLSGAEQTKPTSHPKIMVAQVREYPYDLALNNEIELYNLSLNADDMAIVKKMKEIVPEYKSRHSKYEALDN